MHFSVSSFFPQVKLKKRTAFYPGTSDIGYLYDNCCD